MPWKAFACVALVGCSFSADYKGGLYQCSDNVCPTGSFCYEGFCRDGDGGIPDAKIDAPASALTCADPGELMGTTTGDTTGRTSQVSAMCGGAIQNGPDAVYKLHAKANQHVTLKITGVYQADAYLLASPCEAAPAVPACLSDELAVQNNPVTVIAPADGDYFVVVDGENPAMSGGYAITVTLL